LGLGLGLLPFDSFRRHRLPDLREEALSDLRTFGLTKAYGTTQALAGIDLEVPTGSVYGLVGPNGSGKTTAFEILAGLRRPSAGSIELGVERDSVAYCPDSAEFEPWLTAIEVLEVVAGLLGRPRSRTALVDMLERVGLAFAAKRRAGGFSRGMTARLGLAAGLIGEPKLLIADEPAAALDPAGRWEIIDLIATLAGSMTVLISSHDLADVERICDRIGVLSKGRLVYQGPIAELLNMASPALRVVVRPPAGHLLAVLAAAPWVRSVSEDAPGELRVETSDADAAEIHLPEVLAACGARLVEVCRAGVSLQDIFFRMTETGPYRHQILRDH
jgi:ABC-2 type transport system ATP-binding protein